MTGIVNLKPMEWTRVDQDAEGLGLDYSLEHITPFDTWYTVEYQHPGEDEVELVLGEFLGVDEAIAKWGEPGAGDYWYAAHASVAVMGERPIAGPVSKLQACVACLRDYRSLITEAIQIG